MKDKLDQFVNNLNGQFVEVSDRTNVYQCMDLVYLWVFCLGYPKATIQKLYAYQVYTQPSDLTRQYFDLLPNTATFIPQDGDIAVFDRTSSNVAGHIGVALGGGTITSFRCFEQNYPIGTNAAIRIRNYNTPRLLGVLRPKVFPSTAPVINDRTIIPIGGTYGSPELQQVRSMLIAKDQELANQTNTINNLTQKLNSIRAIVA